MGAVITKKVTGQHPKVSEVVEMKNPPTIIDENRKELVEKYCKQTTNSKHVAALINLAVNVESIALKCENTEELLTPETFAVAKKITSVYYSVKLKLARQLLSSLANDLEHPKLTFNIISMMIQTFPDITKWDQEKKDRESNQSVKLVELEAEQVEENLKRAQVLVSQLLSSTLSFSDIGDKYSLSCGEVGIIPLCVKMIEELKDCIPDMIPFVDKSLQKVKKFTVRGMLLRRALGVLHNLVKRMPNRIRFESCNAIDVLLPLMKAEVTLFATKSLFCLAYLADESNNDLIMAGSEPIMFIVNGLHKALGLKLRKYLGFSAAELVDGLIQIGINDQNKKKIVDCGAIPVVVLMIETAQDQEECLLAAKCFWVLAFDENNQNVMRSNEGCMAALDKLKASSDKETRTAASGALWEIVGKGRHSENKENVPESDVSVQGSLEINQHIMISYQWDVQSIMIQVKNRLQASGYKVWMDLEDMGGSTLEAMAKAVEDSAVVLVCVSQKYKESPNCRSEAEYAFSLHKDIIPLMMEKHYRPDGWLGMIVGSKLWFEFVERQMIDSSTTKLAKELGRRGMVGGAIIKHVTKAKTADPNKPDIRRWTNDDVSSWLKSIGLSSVSNKTREWLDGKMLIRLHNLRRESPEFFYSSIKDELDLKHLPQVLTFADELEKLTG